MPVLSLSLDRQLGAGQQLLARPAHRFRFAEQLMPVEYLRLAIIISLHRPDTTFSGTALADSEPLYWVAASGVDEAMHEAAVEYVFNTLVVPEPSSVVLAAIAGVGALLLWRRRQRVNVCSEGAGL